ncbi:MAG: hypothetical protein Nkreftii_000463 [Candidatus Nitrospira kreftii]|uniref:Uncharacterized protein n=1 Tax=Candidatus Nitrospira kreftii TaxID=2652173 RepID=A0A7S8FAV2_9BACT|nr:MAG: hypothetical protein Nkreftii_000463 [Candidatus Nitrospira kreftii]
MSNADSEIPKFALHGEDTPAFDDSIQPTLDLRSWSDVPKEERSTALRQIVNSGWMNKQGEILGAIAHLNATYLRLCPGKNLHNTNPQKDIRFGRNFSHLVDYSLREAAANDFARIFLEEAEPLVLRMLSKYAQLLIVPHALAKAKRTVDSNERAKHVRDAFESFDRFADCVNHVFEQFAVNQLMTRTGFMPRQDKTIEQELYKPTLKALSDPKWGPVNKILAPMFEDFRESRYSETITKAHSAVHCFLQILVGKLGTNAKGELGRLMKEGKEAGLIPTNRFTEPFLGNIQSFISSERATNSTAKPSLMPTSSSDALLMMNLTLVFLQYCLQGRHETKVPHNFT